MCGRYYIDDDTIREMEKLVRQIDKKLLEEKSRDVFPPRVHLWSREERERDVYKRQAQNGSIGG